MPRLSSLLAAVPLFALTACSAPVTEVFDASDVANSAPTARCPDFSGLWAIENGDHCQPQEESLHGTVALQLPGDGGYMYPAMPAVVEIRQGGCEWIRFRVVDEAPTPYPSVGGETRVPLRPGKKIDVSWSDDRLAVRRREPLTGPMIFPGFARSWSAWSLELEDADTVDYRYVFVHKGASFFLFPFSNESGSSCSLRRVEDPDAAWQ